MNEMSITKKMLAKLREGRDRQAREAAEQFVMEEEVKDNFLTVSKTLMNEAVEESKKKILTEEDSNDSSHTKYFEIRKDTPQFGDVRVSQEETLRKTIGEDINLENDALKYYPNSNDITLEGKIPSLNLSFQFRYLDPSGQGVYIWCDSMQLTEENTRTIGKMRNAFLNWKNSIIQDGDLVEKLKKAANRENQ